jgi:hypothetical protein
MCNEDQDIKTKVETGRRISDGTKAHNIPAMSRLRQQDWKGTWHESFRVRDVMDFAAERVMCGGMFFRSFVNMQESVLGMFSFPRSTASLARHNAASSYK